MPPIPGGLQIKLCDNRNPMRVLLRIAPIVATLLWHPPVVAQQANEFAASDQQALAELEVFLDSVDELQQSFVQSRYSADGDLLDQVSGRMALRQPGNFRWEVLHPWQQYIVVNAENFWSYDPDLQQAVKRSSKQVLQYTPAAVLMRLERPEQYFSVNYAEPAEDGSRPLQLLPHNPGVASFQQLILHYSGSVLHSISYTDLIGQRTEMLFGELAEPFTAGGPSFTFQPPPGVDVIEQEQL